MDVFALRDALVGEYKAFATSFTQIYASDIREQIANIYASERFWPEPLIQINPSYKRTRSIADLVQAGALDPHCAEIFRTEPSKAFPKGEPLPLYRHQEEAIALAAQNNSFVVTTGTGSGKSLCFFIPIIDAVLRNETKNASPRTRAIIVYPMNALANSQLEEINKYLENIIGPAPVTFDRYTGQDPVEERQRISQYPPDILLTNFMMLELLMTRQDDLDRRVMANCVGLQFLVLDELHTYRGRQGADVALLVRRVRERLAPKGLQCIGTSATMASVGTLVDKSRAVAEVSSKIFAADIPESNVVVETLERMTDPLQNAESVKPRLGAAIDAGFPRPLRNAELRGHPLAIWIETRLGIAWSEIDQRWLRARPSTISEAVHQLSEDAERSVEACRGALRDLLLLSGVPEDERVKDPDGDKRSFFAFKLHQFISGAGHAFATLELAGRRRVTVEGQQFLPGDGEKRLYATHFCRDCGHEYHPVRLTTINAARIVLARDIDDVLPAQVEDENNADLADEDYEGERFGFLTLHPDDATFTFEDRQEDYPESWLDFDANGEPRLKSSYRRQRPISVRVAPSGQLGAGTRAWFLPGKFRLCLRCNATHGGPGRDRTRLASLSAEGRSSATTILVGSTLRWMHGEGSGLDQYKRKLLGFTDNRQDAALQAGHFNDFLFVSLLRAGFFGALQTAGQAGLGSDELGIAQRRALGFDHPDIDVRTEWLQEPTLRGFNLQEAEKTLREVLAYRVWFDQRRGWRYTNPNLEQLNLVQIDYSGLGELAADQELFETAPPLLRHASPVVRAKVYRRLLDHLRQGMAIRSHVLDATVIEQLLGRSHSRLRAPWGFGPDEKPRHARWLLIAAPSRRGNTLRDEDLIVRGGARSMLGRKLRSAGLWDNNPAARAMNAEQYGAVLNALLNAASTHGLLSQEVTPFDNLAGWKLTDACIRFRANSNASSQSSRENAFFRDFYTNLSHLLRQPTHPLFGFEAREHTAQVDGEKRQVREKRFRFGEKERAELIDDEKHLRDIGEVNRFLPVLFCSPTMELGVDISALNAVYLRNVPPTPANYAQRSGRAGRSGQAALVVTYCSSQSPHDQYFFRDPKAMVHGEVRPPILDLANHDLVDSHLQAIWLACTDEPLDPSISEVLVLSDLPRPVREELRKAMSEPRVAAEATSRIERVLDLLSDDLTVTDAPWYPGRDLYARQVSAGAFSRFEQAFNRWRNLFSSAEQQRDAARRAMDNYSAVPQERRAAQSRHAQAIDQLNLLQKGTSSFSSDFYTYRYLATEGFLPGYNFPRLPLMAYIPATNDGRGRQTYLQRPRFLALSEFGPRSLVYHEGRAYRVVRALLSLGTREHATADVHLPTKTVRICRNCGAAHFDDQTSMCHSCMGPLGDAEIVRNIYRIENVATQPAERITANDEERQRQGFELQTTFEWGIRDHQIDARRAEVTDTDGPVVRLQYGPGATITRLNKGLRRRANRTQFGFKIDPVSGYWARNIDEDTEPTDPMASPRQWIVPSVQDRKNALLLQPTTPELSQTTLATVQHALLRGIEAVFQLEEGEVFAEPLPARDARTGFLLYEATEGGAGVLTRLVAEKTALALVARAALKIMHFDIPDADPLPSCDKLVDVADTACVAACYKCLMSYYNQPDHDLIDRRDSAARELLLRLAASRTGDTLGVDRPIEQIPAAPLIVTRDLTASPANPLMVRWRAMADELGLLVPDAEPMSIDGQAIQPVWRSHYIAAALAALPANIVTALEDRGFEVIEFGQDEKSWPDAFRHLTHGLGL